MKTTLDYLDAVSARLGGVSDYRISKTLGISHQAICNWRKGRDSIGDDAAMKIADLLGVEPAEILIVSRIERTQNVAVRAAWENAIRKLAGAAATIALSVFALFSSSFVSGDAYAAVTAEGVRLCILCKALFARCRRLFSRRVRGPGFSIHMSYSPRFPRWYAGRIFSAGLIAFGYQLQVAS